MRAPVRGLWPGERSLWDGWFWTAALGLATIVPLVAIVFDRAPRLFSSIVLLALGTSAVAAHNHPRRASDVLFAAALLILLMTLFLRPPLLWQWQGGMFLLALVGWTVRRAASPPTES